MKEITDRRLFERYQAIYLSLKGYKQAKGHCGHYSALKEKGILLS